MEVIGTGQELLIDCKSLGASIRPLFIINGEITMNKIVYNACYGGYALSSKANEWLRSKGVINLTNLERHNPLLVECVEELKEEASAEYSDLRVAEIEGNIYRIEEYDGCESVVTPEEDWVIIK